MTGWDCPNGAARRLILIRHGEPERSAKGRCYGKLDVGLSAAGRIEMARLSETLASTELDVVYTSPRRRARESAEQITSDAIVDDDLAEIDFGELEGLTYDAAALQYPDVYARWMERPTEVQFPGGESFPQMKARVLAALTRARGRRQHKTIGVVSHGGVSRIVLAQALGIDDADVFRLAQDYAGVNIIDEIETELDTEFDTEFDRHSIVRLMNGRLSC